MEFEQGKIYLTKEGLERLKKEKDKVKKAIEEKIKIEKPRMAAPHGVDSEYLTFQEEIDRLETRLREIEEILKNYRLITPPKKDQRNVVHLGATILVEVDGRIDEFTIVGSIEANPAVGKISYESPVGKALLGRREGETIFLSSPVKVAYKIKKIKYEI